MGKIKINIDDMSSKGNPRIVGCVCFLFLRDGNGDIMCGNSFLLVGHFSLYVELRGLIFAIELALAQGWMDQTNLLLLLGGVVLFIFICFSPWDFRYIGTN